MPTKERIMSKYPGVYHIELKAPGTKRLEKVFYIFYRKDGRQIEEKVGRTGKDDMTPARASSIRAEKMQGKQPSNRERREVQRQEKWTISALWREYRKTRPDLKGIATDESRFDLHLKDPFGSKEPKDLSPLDIDRLRIKLFKSHAPQTVKNTLELLRRIINFAIKKRLIPRIELLIEMPKVNNLKTEDLAMEQIGALLAAIDADPGNRGGAIMKLALLTGMRKSEIFGLKWEDVDLGRDFLFLRDPKGGPSQNIPLGEAARKVILDQKKGESPFVFPGRGGMQLVDVRKAINKIRKAAGLPKDFRPLHGLRHTFASTLASSGEVDLYHLQRLLTHKSAVMTQRYAHLRDDALRRASNLAGEIIGQTTAKPLDNITSLQAAKERAEK
jgi:integrase